jgi:hypothetical protein
MAASLSERAAYHEAGHCAAAIAFGIPVIRVSIDSATPHLLPTQRDGWETLRLFSGEILIFWLGTPPRAQQCSPPAAITLAGHLSMLRSAN